jgi:DNA-binding transcriptional MerR regulator/methylmalonyl-CoA mutase cobalamin-binding subunit
LPKRISSSSTIRGFILDKPWTSGYYFRVKKKSPRPGHPIQVVSLRTGLSPDVLRAWERRYGAVTPARSPSGRRLYSDEDLERLLLLRRATLAGRAIGQVARVPSDDLLALVEQDEEAAAQAPRSPRERPGPAEEPSAARHGPGRPYLESSLEAVRALDGDALESSLARASVHLGPAELMAEVLAPLMRRLGDLWQQGDLRVAQEHLASAVVRSLLGGLAGRHTAVVGSPGLVVATPPGQRHELGAMMVAVTAAAEGWNVAYLGPDLPAEEIAAAAAETGSRLVALSIIHPAGDSRLAAQIQLLARLLPEGVDLVVGGASAATYGEALENAGARRLGNLEELRELLRELRG